MRELYTLQRKRERVNYTGNKKKESIGDTITFKIQKKA